MSMIVSFSNGNNVNVFESFISIISIPITNFILFNNNNFNYSIIFDTNVSPYQFW